MKIRINKKFLPHANVGRITNKTRDTANRTNGFERLREFPSINGISTDNIYDSASKSQVRLNKLQNYSISQKERTRKWSQVCGIQVPLEETKFRFICKEELSQLINTYRPDVTSGIGSADISAFNIYHIFKKVKNLPESQNKTVSINKKGGGLGKIRANNHQRYYKAKQIIIQ